MTTARIGRVELAMNAFIALAAVLCIVLGVIALIAWNIHHFSWIQLDSHSPPVQYNTALGLVLVGASFLSLIGRYPRFVAVCAAILFALGSLSLAEYAFPVDLGIDQLMLVSHVAANSAHPGRLSFADAMEFILIAIAIGTSVTFKCRPLIIGSLGAITATIGAVALFAYVIGITPIYRWYDFNMVPPQVTIVFVLAGLALIAFAWREEVRRQGNIMRWLPLSIAAALVIATLLLWQALLAQERSHVSHMIQSQLTLIENKITSRVQSHVIMLMTLIRESQESGGLDESDLRMEAPGAVDLLEGFRALGRINASGQLLWVVSANGTEVLRRALAASGTAGQRAWRTARTQRFPTMASPVNLQQGESVFFVYVPVFTRTRFEGFLIGVFRPDILVKAIAADVGSGYAVRLSTQGYELSTVRETGKHYEEAWHEEGDLNLYGTKWHIQIIPTTDLVERVRSHLPLVVLLAGLLTSGLLSFVLYLSQAARLRSRDLELANLDLGREVEERRRAEARFRNLLESAPDAMVIVDGDGRIVLTNSQVEKLFGYQASELLNQPVEVLMPARSRARHPDFVRGYVTCPTSRQMASGLELYALRKNGEEFPAEISLSPLKTEEGALISAAIRDLAERHRREEALRQSEERFRLVVEGARDYAIFMLDTRGDVTSWNAGAESIIGYRSDEIIGRHFSRFFTEEEIAEGKPQRELENALADGRLETEGLRVRKDGSRFWCHVIVTPLWDVAGRLRGFSKITRDITERKQAETALNRQTGFIQLLQHVAVAANEAETIDEAMQVALDEICEVVGWPLGHLCIGRRKAHSLLMSTAIWRVDDADRYEAFVSASKDLSFDDKIDFPGRVLKTGKAAYVASLDDWPNSPRVAIASRVGINAGFAFPLLIKSRVVGVLEFFSPDATLPDSALLSVMAQIGTQLGRVVERKWAEEAVREFNDSLEQRVTDRTAQAEQARTRLAFLAEASSVLSASLDFADTLAHVARLAVPYLAEWCVVDLLDDKGRIQRVKLAHGDPQIEALCIELDRRYLANAAAESGPANVIRTGQPQLISMVTDDMLVASARDVQYLPVLQGLDLGSYMCVPLISRGVTLGAMTFIITSPSGRRYDETDLAFAQDLARRCATAVDNARLYQAAQDEVAERRRAEKEIRFQAHLLSAVGEAVIATDLNGSIIYANAFAVRLYGWSIAELQGKDVFDIVAPQTHARAREIVARVATGETWAGEFQMRRRDGSVFPANVSKAPIFDEEGHLIGIIGVSADITDRKEAERVIEQRARQQAEVARIGQRALEGLSLSELLDEAVAGVAANLNVEFCKVLELLPDRTALFLRAGFGWKDGVVGNTTVPADLNSQAGYTLASQDPVIVPDLRKETRFSSPPLAHQHGLISGVSVTIPGHNAPFGVLGAHSSRMRLFNRDDVHFMQAVANVLASAIERRRTEEERTELLVHEQAARLEAEAARTETEEARRRMALLAEASGLFAVSLDVHSTLEQLTRLAVPVLADWCAIDLVEPDGTFRRAAAAHIRPEKESLVYELQSRYPTGREAEYGYHKVLYTGRSDFYPEVPGRFVMSQALNSEHSRLSHELGFASFMCVPLSVRGQILGAATLVHGESGRRFSEADLALAEDLAHRAALALDNAKLYQAAQQEIAERRRAEDLLADEKERLAVTLHSIGDGVITTDREGRVVLLNKIAEDLTGWSQQEAMGQRLDEVFHIINERTRQACENPVDKVLKSGQIIALANHTALIARDGTERVIADSGAPIRDRDGGIIGVVLVFRDISEQQKMEEDLQKSQKLESIGILAGGIAHDFNNILTAILGNISLAKMYAAPGDRISEALTDAENAFWRARDLTHQLLTFSKGGAPIKKTASIAELLRDTCGFVLSGSNVKCELEIFEGLWPAQFDVGQISQVINNLLINAQQAMQDGGVIRVTAENAQISKKSRLPLAKGRYIRIAIRDHGIGIPEEHLSRIFDPYFTTKQTGSGLGLATSYSIVKKHDGYIEVQSQVGNGTTFSVYLPASNESIATESALVQETLAGQGRILFMDDEETVRRVGGEILRRLGYEVEFAGAGTEMLARYKEAKQQGRSFDAVIMDLTIPGAMGGKEAIGKLIEFDPQAIAIVSSGYFNDPVMADYESYGFRGVIAKPYKVKELSKIVHQAIKGAKKEESL